MAYVGDLTLLSDLPDSEYTAYTPTFTNITVGTGASVTFRYRTSGTGVHVIGELTFGTGGSVTAGAPYFTLPTGIASNQRIIGQACYNDATGSRYWGCAVQSASVIVLYTNASPLSGISSSTPFTWTSGDTISVGLHYEST